MRVYLDYQIWDYISKNDDINVSDLSVKLTRIKDNASKA